MANSDSIRDGLDSVIYKYLPIMITRVDGSPATVVDREKVARGIAHNVIANYAVTSRAYEEPEQNEVTGDWLCGSGPELAACNGNENPNWLYNKGANYIRLAEHIEGIQKEAKLTERRDALARKFIQDTDAKYQYANTSMKLAIDYALELEGEPAAREPFA